MLEKKSIDLEGADWKALDKIATAKGIKRSVLIRLIIRYYLDNKKSIKLI